MARRYKIGKSYVIRKVDGKFNRWSAIGRSLNQDKKIKAVTIVKSGYGYRGDQKRK